MKHGHLFWKYEYVSRDGSGNGGIWTDLSSSIPTNQPTSFDNFNTQGSYDLVVSVHPTDPAFSYYWRNKSRDQQTVLLLQIIHQL